MIWAPLSVSVSRAKPKTSLTGSIDKLCKSLYCSRILSLPFEKSGQDIASNLRSDLAMEIVPQLLLNALISGSIYALITVGLALTYGLLRILNFAHGHLMMVGAYLFYWSSIQLGLGLLCSALLTALLSALLGCLTLRIFILPFSKFNFILVLVATLGLATLLESAVAILFGVNVRSLAISSSQSMQLGPIFITAIQLWIIVSALTILSLIAFLVHSTSYGRRVRALSETSYAAEALGVSQHKTTFVVFTIAMLLTALAGVMVGFETNLQPTMGNSYTIKAFAAMILGGLGNVWGAVAGSYILGLVENLSIGLEFGPYSLPAGYKDAFSFLLILLVLLFRPLGLFSPKTRAF